MYWLAFATFCFGVVGGLVLSPYLDWLDWRAITGGKCHECDKWRGYYEDILEEYCHLHPSDIHYGEPSDAEVTAYLAAEGIDMTEANKRLHEMIAKAKRGDAMPDYGEPWYTETQQGRGFYSDKEGYIGECEDCDYTSRIISCVNSCRDIENPEEVVPLMIRYFRAYAGWVQREESPLGLEILAVLQPKREGE